MHTARSADHDHAPKARLIFIGGAPRSGTTLVQRIMASHSRVYGGPEFDLIPKIIELRAAFLTSVDQGRIGKYLSKDDINDLFANFIANAFQYKLDQTPGKTHLSEKTPANVMVFGELAEMFPNAHLVFVLRDPRAIVASMLAVGKRYREEGISPPIFTRNARAATAFINECWRAGHEALKQHRNIHVVYYEDIVEHTNDAVAQLVATLGLDFEPGMTDLAAYDMPEFKSREHLWYTREQLSAPLSRGSLQSWQDQLSAYEAFIIQRRIIRPDTVARYSLDCGRSPFMSAIESVGFFGWSLKWRIRRRVITLGKSLYRTLGGT